MRKLPLELAVPDRVSFVSTFSAVTTAPATAPPLLSVTSPPISPVIFCAGRGTAERRISTRAKEKYVHRRLSIGMPPHWQIVGPLAKLLGEILFRAGLLSTKFPIIPRMRRCCL